MLREQDLSKTVRYPIDAKEAKNLLDHLRDWDGKVSSQWKARANANQSTMETGDPFGYVEVFKGLSKLEAEGSLRASDRVHLNQSLEFLVEEVAHALGKSEEHARSKIVEAGQA